MAVVLKRTDTNKKMRRENKWCWHQQNDIKICPCRKAGQDKGKQSGRNRPPIVISRTVLESYFNMQQRKVCDELVSFCAVILRVVISAQLECLCHDLMGVD